MEIKKLNYSIREVEEKDETACKRSCKAGRDGIVNWTKLPSKLFLSKPSKLLIPTVLFNSVSLFEIHLY